jgi:hypothetical protein
MSSDLLSKLISYKASYNILNSPHTSTQIKNEFVQITRHVGVLHLRPESQDFDVEMSRQTTLASCLAVLVVYSVGIFFNHNFTVRKNCVTELRCLHNQNWLAELPELVLPYKDSRDSTESQNASRSG